MRLPSEYAAELRSTSDADQVARLRNGLAKAARELVVRSMRTICARHGAADDAEDGAQELVTTLVDRIVAGTIPPRHGEEDQYLQRSARNRARDILTGKGIYKHRRYAVLGPAHEPQAEPFPTAQREAEQAWMLELVRDALGELHETYREVIEAHRFRGVPLYEIAEQWLEQGRAETLPKAQQNVQAAHSRGMKRLRQLVLARVEQEQEAQR